MEEVHLAFSAQLCGAKKGSVTYKKQIIEGIVMKRFINSRC